MRFFCSAGINGSRKNIEGLESKVYTIERPDLLAIFTEWGRSFIGLLPDLC